MSERDVVLAFSGGLDTSYCVPRLTERGYAVTTLFADTGGVDAAERSAIEARALELGAVRHVTRDAGQDLWDEVVVPLVQGGVFYQGQYPVLCSDRYLIVRHCLDLARELETRNFAHGCTAMGNDQVRFDVTARALGEVEILAPIRDLQEEQGAGNVRDYERAWLEERGFAVPVKASRYTINENLLGVTISGAEIDTFGPPSDAARLLCAPARDWPREPLSLTLDFEGGVAVALDGRPTPGPALLAELNRRLGAYGVGRGLYTGDTTIGIKGRIVFEAPGIVGLVTAHRALEEAVLTAEQNAFKPRVATKWIDLVYRGLFVEPLKLDLEALLTHLQAPVSGRVTLATSGGACEAVAVESEGLLLRRGAVYAQSADWTRADAEGFIRLFGQGTVLAARR